MANKMINCKSCGHEISSNAKTCPNCGAKNSKPIYQKPWFIVLAVLIVLSIIGNGLGNNDNSSSKNPNQNSSQKDNNEQKEGNKEPEKQEEVIEYEITTVSQLMDDLKTNALKAQETYKDKYYELTGKLSTIDASGKYISLVPGVETFEISGIQCKINNDELRAQVAEMKEGDTVTLRGKITDVGEVLGYTLTVDSIDGYEPSGNNETETTDGYIVCTATQLENDLKENALKASNTYKGKEIAVTGKLSNIDSSGKYISISPTDNPYSLTIIQCYIKTDDVKSTVMELSGGDIITIYGKCKDVGEVLGYSIDIERIEK